MLSPNAFGHIPYELVDIEQDHVLFVWNLCPIVVPNCQEVINVAVSVVVGFDAEVIERLALAILVECRQLGVEVHYG